jgi:hypothetical protein
VTMTQVGTSVNFVVDLADGPPNTVGWAQTGAADFQLFKFNATDVVVGDITVTQRLQDKRWSQIPGPSTGTAQDLSALGSAAAPAGTGILGSPATSSSALLMRRLLT